MKKWIIRMGLVLSLLWASFTFSVAFSKDLDDEALIQQQIRTFFHILFDEAPAVKDAKKRDTLVRDSLRDNFKMDTFTGAVLGKYQRSVSDSQRAALQEVLEAHVLQTYEALLQKGDVKIDALKFKPLNYIRADKSVAIQEIFVSAKGEKPSNIALTLRKTDGKWWGVNLIFNGINLGLNYRASFDKSMLVSGGDFEKALAIWKKGLSAAETTAP